MTIQPKGYDECLRRVDELRSRIRSMIPETSEPKPGSRPSPLQGSIGGGGFEPMDPFGRQVSLNVSPPPQDIQKLISKVSSQVGVDHDLFESLVQAESDFNPREVSSKGALGLTQLMPGTAKALGISDPMDPEKNLLGGAKYLHQLLNQFNGDERLALAAYNAGPGAVRRFDGIPPYKETQHYVDKIMARVASLRGRP